MGLANPGRALRPSYNFCKAFDSVWHPALFHKLISAGPLLGLLVGLNLSLLIGMLAWYIKITKVVPFESVEVFRKNPFLGLYFSLFSSMIFLASLPSSVSCSLYADDLAIRSLQRWRPHKELCFDWSVGLSSGVFLSIRANMRPLSFQWIPTKLISSPTSPYTTPASISIPLQLFLGSPSTTLFPFLNTYLC